jgi:uncharacterized membrane protein
MSEEEIKMRKSNLKDSHAEQQTPHGNIIIYDIKNMLESPNLLARYKSIMPNKFYLSVDKEKHVFYNVVIIDVEYVTS